jgi:hypothetical protein
MKLSIAFAVCTVLSVADAKSLRSSHHNHHIERRDTERNRGAFAGGRGWEGGGGRAPPGGWDSSSTAPAAATFPEDEYYDGDEYYDSGPTVWTDEYYDSGGPADAPFPLDDILRSMDTCVKEIKYVCYDDAMSGMQGSTLGSDGRATGWPLGMPDDMFSDFLPEDYDEGFYDDDYYTPDSYEDVEDPYDYDTPDSNEGPSFFFGGGWRKLASVFNGLHSQEMRGQPEMHFNDRSTKRNPNPEATIAGGRGMDDISSRLRAMQREVKTVVQKMEREGETKSDFIQMMEENPELKDLVEKFKALKMNMKMKEMRPNPPIVGAPPHPFERTDMDRPSRSPDRETGHWVRKLGQIGQGAWPGDSSCPNGDLDFLVQNLSPKCADIMLTLVMPPPPPFFEPFPMGDAPNWLTNEDFPHPGGPHHRFGGPHHRFGDHDSHPPPPGCEGSPLAGIVFIGAIVFFCVRYRRKRSQVIRGEIGQSGGGGTPSMPVGVVVNNGQGQPQVFTGEIVQSSKYMHGTPMFVDYALGQQQQASTTAQSSVSTVAGASVISNNAESFRTFAPAAQLYALGQQQQASAPAQSSASTNAGAPIISNNAGSFYTFAPAPQLSF